MARDHRTHTHTPPETGQDWRPILASLGLETPPVKLGILSPQLGSIDHVGVRVTLRRNPNAGRETRYAASVPRVGISTLYRASRLPEPRLLLEHALELGAEGLGIDATLPRDLLEALLPTLARRQRELPVLAVRLEGPPFLASLDRDERRAALERAAADLRVCGELACPLVIGLGRLAPDARWRALGRSYVRGEDLEGEAMDALIQARRRAADLALPGARAGLEALANVAARDGVRVAFLPRGRPDELVTPVEAERLLEELRGAPVGYWHDTARAVLGRLLRPQVVPWDAFLPAALGQDAADICGLFGPLAPGLGEGTAELACPVTCDTVVRCDGRSAPDEVRRAIARLRGASA